MGLDITVHKIVKKQFADSENSYFMLIDKDGNYKNDCPSWTKKFETDITEYRFDWGKYKDETGFDINNHIWLEDFYDDENDREIMVCVNKDAKENEQGFYDKKDEIKIDLDKVPSKSVNMKGLYYQEVGYQRRGLNDKFYEEYEEGKIGYLVWDLKTLEHIKTDCCDKVGYYINGGKYYPQKNFQKNIIDKFTEGECCVSFDW